MNGNRELSSHYKYKKCSEQSMLVSPCDSAFQPVRFHAKSPLVYEQITSSLANESARFMIDKNVVWDSVW